MDVRRDGGAKQHYCHCHHQHHTTAAASVFERELERREGAGVAGFDCQAVCTYRIPSDLEICTRATWSVERRIHSAFTSHPSTIFPPLSSCCHPMALGPPGQAVRDPGELWQVQQPNRLCGVQPSMASRGGRESQTNVTLARGVCAIVGCKAPK